jgi:hypothetical protein
MPDKCDPIRAQIAESRAEIKDLQEQRHLNSNVSHRLARSTI